VFLKRERIERGKKLWEYEKENITNGSLVIISILILGFAQSLLLRAISLLKDLISMGYYMGKQSHRFFGFLHYFMVYGLRFFGNYEEMQKTSYLRLLAVGEDRR